MVLRLLVLDAYAPEGREALRSAGGSEAGPLYVSMLHGVAPDAHIDVAHPADPGPELPTQAELRDYDGAAWTGSSLTIHRDDDPRVSAQLDFARRLLDAGVSCFGSCWAAQLAAVVSGGRCAPSPRGREFGFARRIALSPQGRAHALFAGKAPLFDAFTSHADEVVSLGSGAHCLASNAWSRVQAVSFERAAGRFWALQYHPEYDLHEVASLCRLRRKELVAQGTFANARAADYFIRDLEALHADPGREDLARSLGVSADLLDPRQRSCEVRNWLATLKREPAA